MIKKILITFIISIIIILCFFFLMLAPLKESGQVLKDGWKYSYKGGSMQDVSFPFYKNTHGPASALFTIKPKKTSDTTLAVIWPDVTALEIFWNGKIIYTLGDPDQPTGNFWNYFYIIELPEAPDGTDTLSFKAHGYYSINFGKAPYIGDRKTLLQRSMFHNIVYNELLLIFIGGVLVLGLMLFLTPAEGIHHKISSRLLGAASLISCMHFLDYHLTQSLGTSLTYIIFKKIFFISGIAASLFFLLSLFVYYRTKTKIKYVMIFLTAISVLIISFVKLETVRYILPYIDIVLLLNILTTVAIIFIHKDNRKIMLISAQILFLSVLESILVLLLNLSWPLLIQNMIIIAVLLFSIQLIYYYNTIYSSHEKISDEVMKDPLTGIHNRRTLDSLALNDYDYIVVIDLDNFKYYNDTYGHQAGDELLINFAEIIKKNLRKNDIVIRYGGDEFVVLICNVTQEVCNKIFDRICEGFKQYQRDEKIGFSYGISEVSGDHMVDIKNADKAMYEMKRKKSS